MISYLKIKIYFCRLVIEPNHELSINNGTVKIDMKNDPKIDGIQPIVLDIKNIEIIKADVMIINEDNSTAPIEFEGSYGNDNQTYEITLSKSYHQSPISIRVYLIFKSQLTDTLQGFYKTTYFDEKINDNS